MDRNRAALVVDDDDFVRSLLLRQLAALGFTRVDGADSVSAACQRLASAERYDVVLCDLVMPGADGVELLREIATLQAGAALLLVSRADHKTLRSVEELARGRGLWVLGALRKPVALPDLRGLLMRLAGGAPARAPSAGAIDPAELDAALRAGAIQAYVQPKVGVRDRALVGVEALARWPRAGAPPVSPEVFVAVAERHGLIDALTENVARQALQACGAWKRDGLCTRVAINVAMVSLSRLQLPETLAALAAASGVEPWQVTVEVTESGVMADPVTALDVLTRLRLRGFELAIDDFGAGYSSLKQLQRVPFNELKVDMSFVRPMLEDREARHIVESSVRLARELGLRSVAEGVESEGHLVQLEQIGCDVAQGFFIARPLPAAQLPAWARSR
jgi:EAL domain-containing protein (putative c-di-GMP-specific phosphodiesterase class I)